MGDLDDGSAHECAAQPSCERECWWRGDKAKKGRAVKWSKTLAGSMLGEGKWVCGAPACKRAGRGYRDRAKPRPPSPPPPLVPPPAPAATAAEATGPLPAASVAPRTASARASVREAGAAGSSSASAAPGPSVHP